MSNFQRVIVADDDHDDLLLFQEALKEISPDTELDSVTNGKELLTLLTGRSLPDAIFLDLYIPGRNGRECVHEIRNNPEYDNMLVIVLSGSRAQSDRDYCLKNGADYFFTKPNSYSELKDIIASFYTRKYSAARYL